LAFYLRKEIIPSFIHPLACYVFTDALRQIEFIKFWQLVFLMRRQGQRLFKAGLIWNTGIMDKVLPGYVKYTIINLKNELKHPGKRCQLRYLLQRFHQNQIMFRFLPYGFGSKLVTGEVLSRAFVAGTPLQKYKRLHGIFINNKSKIVSLYLVTQTL
jgi:hypothetical protein